MGTNLITTEELFKLKEKEKEEKKYFSTEELMNMSILSPKTSQTPTVNTPEMGQEPVQHKESKIKDIWDSFQLGASGLIHDAKQFFTGTIPNYIFQDIKDSDREYIENKFGLEKGTVTDELMHNVDKKHEVIREKAQIKYDKAEENYQKWLADHPELQPREEWSKGVIETIKENPAILLDPAYWGYVAAQSAAFSIGVMGTTVLATALTGNPLIGMAAGTAMAYPTQAHDLYAELIENGATKEQAAELSVPLGAAIASVETLGDLPILGAISKPFKQMLTKNIKKEVVQSVVKSGVKTFLKAEVSEVLEELVQGAIQDATVKTFDENKNLLENVPETVIQTLIATAPFALFGGGSDMRNTKTKNQIIEMEDKRNQIIKDALDKVTGTEKDIDVIKGIESKFKEEGIGFDTEEYNDIKQQIQDKKLEKPEIGITETGHEIHGEETKVEAPLVSLSTEQLEKINKAIPKKDISKGNLELDKRKLKTPVKEIVSQYVPKEEQTKVEKNINEQINNIIPKTGVKKVEAEALQQEIKEIIQDEINNEIEIYHFSPKKIDVIDPSFMGENLTQAEKDRQANDPVSEKTSAFYTRESNPEKQYVSGTNLYKTKIDKDKLLDIRIPENNKYITQEGNVNETRIKNDGYLGYIAPVNKKAQVRIFESIPAQEVGTVKGSVKQGDSLKPMWNIKMKVESKPIDVTVPQKVSDTKENAPLSSEEMALLEKERGTDLKLNAWEIYKRLEEGHWNGNLAETVRKLSNTQYKKLESMVKRNLKDLDKSLVSKKSLEAVKKVREAKNLEEAILKLPLQNMQELDTSSPSQQEPSPVNVTGDRRSKTGLTKTELEAADFDRGTISPILPAEKNINTRKETAQEVIQKRVVKFSEDVIVYNTQGKEVTLKKGHDYHIYPLEEDGKYRLQDGNQVTMYVGDIADLRDKIVDTAPGEVAGGGMMFPWEKARKEKEAQQQEQEKEKLEDYPKEEGIEEKHTLSKRVYLATVAGDIQAGLTPENLSGYTKADMLSNAERAIDYVNKNYQKAVDMLMYGGEATDAQGHILKGGIFNAVKHIATKSGDVETLYDLALNSHVAREATFLGQQIKAFDEMGQYDAISAIRKLGQYKKEAVSHRIKDLDSAKQKEVENIKSFMGIDIAKLRKKLKSVFRNKDIYCS